MEKASGKIAAENERFDEEITEIMEILYYQRIERGEYGTEKNNWLISEDRAKAEHYLRLRQY
jgi:hypothetical protein